MESLTYNSVQNISGCLSKARHVVAMLSHETQEENKFLGITSHLFTVSGSLPLFSMARNTTSSSKKDLFPGFKLQIIKVETVKDFA